MAQTLARASSDTGKARERAMRIAGICAAFVDAAWDEGSAGQGHGAFPRRVDGGYAMIGRQDNENY
ncbi:hypothetical protein ACFS3C_14670 [Azotobacter vinelandii]|nr:hypothetical protein [Azotobacter vinelandii]WKN20024.1 hypothetical protein AVAEIV_002955 [Azotobacter vinelandii]GLK58958.1 hypothetical protein GCM10017624_11150 [Azotobacter vinelandii]